MAEGAPRILLRLEGAAVLALSLVLYGRQERGWLLFAVLLLAPDLSILGYAAGARVGALSYNALHTYVGPALLALGGIAAEGSAAVTIALIWFAHIGLDRMLGYGLKYPSDFKATHLGTLGGGARRRQT